MRFVFFHSLSLGHTRVLFAIDVEHDGDLFAGGDLCRFLGIQRQIAARGARRIDAYLPVCFAVGIVPHDHAARTCATFDIYSQPAA